VSGCSKELIKPETPLRNISLNSITFVKIVVLIEKELGIEIDDEDLNIDKIATFEGLANIVDKNCLKRDRTI
jgi:Phosphopantetheine attachment site.